MLDGCIKLLKANRTNTSLTLSWKNIGDDGAKKIADALKENTSLTSLYLSNNNIGPVGAQYIAEALKHNTSLTQLSLRSNNIGDDGAKAIADALKENTSLTKLDLSWNNIGDDGAKAIADALKENTSLTKLDLSSNCIGDDGAKAIADALNTNTSLTNLHLCDNNIGPTGAQYIAEALKRNKSLTELSLWGSNNIGDDDAKTLDEAIKNNEYICYAQYENQSQEIKELLVERQNKIYQLISDYQAGKADLRELKKFSKQIEYFAHKENTMLPAEIKIFRAYISGKISEQLRSKCEAHILTPVIKDISPIITQLLGSKDLAKLAIATCLTSLKDEAQKKIEQERQAEQEAELKRQQAEAEQKRIEQERQRANLLKGICAGAIASYATYKLATTFCEAYISETSAMGVSIIAGVAITYFAYTMLESNTVTASLG
jgi:hypothetical protein